MTLRQSPKERILRALGGKEDFPHEAEFLASLAAIDKAEREADEHLHKRIR